MSNKTPFELRFEIFKQAMQLKESEYYQSRDNVMMQYEWDREAAGGFEVGYDPKMPEFPTFSEIRELASKINDFVSNTK